ncbi:MAG: hypothetical protein ACLFPD_11485 [Desulfosudaceae bacterium]
MNDIPCFLEFPKEAEQLEDRLIAAFMQETEAARLERLQDLMERLRICRIMIEQLISEPHLKKKLPQLMDIIENELSRQGL